MARKGRSGGKWDPQRKKGRRRDAHFMDVVLDGYVRHVALEIFRSFEDLTEAYDQDAARAMEELGAFAGAGDYAPIWQEAWRAHVWPLAGPTETPLFGRIEAAVRQALLAERAARQERGDVTLEDTPLYKAFVADAMDNLLEASMGETEEMD